MKLSLLSFALLLAVASCGPNKHVNSWERQSSALDPVGITSKKKEALTKAEQAQYKPGDSVSFKKDKLVVFQQDPEINFSTSGSIRKDVATAKVLVCGELFAKVEFEDGRQGYVSLSEIVNPQEVMNFIPVGTSGLFGADGLLPMPANMGAVSPDAAAATHELALPGMTPAPVQPQQAPKNVPLPESSVKQ